MLRSIQSKQIKYHVNETNIRVRKTQQKEGPLVSEKPIDNGGLKKASMQRDMSGPSTSKMLTILRPAVDSSSSLHTSQGGFDLSSSLQVLHIHQPMCCEVLSCAREVLKRSLHKSARTNSP